MHGIFLRGERIGTVMKIMGEPPKTRWFAFATGERKQGFPRKKGAVEWLIRLREEDEQEEESE